MVGRGLRREGETILISHLEPGEAKRDRRRGLGTEDKRFSGRETAGGGRGSNEV